jgi:hypothetical protein
VIWKKFAKRTSLMGMNKASRKDILNFAKGTVMAKDGVKGTS